MDSGESFTEGKVAVEADVPLFGGAFLPENNIGALAANAITPKSRIVRSLIYLLLNNRGKQYHRALFTGWRLIAN
ncbi:MAG: hypothetical protein ACR2NP_07435 [Pirellulaceae bacterium]